MHEGRAMISRLLRRGVAPLVITIGVLMAATTSHAHLMVEQHGTVNVANGGAFLVLSVPVSTFDGVDDDGDDALSAQELSRHISKVEQQIHDGVQLLDDSGKSLPLQGLLMSLSPSDDAQTAPAKQLIALGRFPIDDPMSSLSLRIALHGKTSDEQYISITATRDGQSHEMTFTPERDYHTMFPKKEFAE
jgi:hypothetical protein